MFPCFPEAPLSFRSLLRGFALCVALTSATAAEKISFNRDIRPILSENCFQCHGPDKNHRKADLRLDVREEALAAQAFTPGKPDQGELLRRVFSTDEEEQMPPAKANRTLTDAQKQLLKRWIAEGAEYEPHWAYVVPTRPALPTTKGRSAGNPIDAFILAVLERERLSPASEADRRTLIRRLSLDLTGLPPEPRDVEAFVASRDPRAYETLVQRYLASPHFGERLAIHWLDLVRFADTIGFHNDVEIRTWPYRDYVIKAFNDNLPFDQFTREQLAGDLLPGSTMTQRVGSAYNRLHRISGEGGIQDKEYFTKYAADRVRTTATVWMGSTLACAECHDHKFDPFTTKDFYRMEAIFADLREKGAYNLSGGFTRDNLTEETIFETPEQEQRMKALEGEIRRLNDEIKAIKDDQLAAGRAAWEAEVMKLIESVPSDSVAATAEGGDSDDASSPSIGWQVQRPLRAESTVGTPLRIEASDHSIVPGGVNPANDTYVVTVPAPSEPTTALRLEIVSDARFAGDDVARAGSMFFISEIEVEGRGGDAGPTERIRVGSAKVSGGTEPGYPVEAAIDGDPSTALSFLRKQRRASIALHFAEPWRGGTNATFSVRIRHSEKHPYRNLGRFRVALRTHDGPEVDNLPEPVLTALKLPRAERKPAQDRQIATHYRTLAPELAALRQKLTAATNARDHLLISLPSVPVSKSVEPRTIRVLPRGNWMDDSGEIVESGVPGFMRQAEPGDGKRVSRLDFANWLVAPDNPLTARTFVNRIWRLYFGVGLVRTLEDLGSQGEWPSHPELLDWLAVEFRESGWNVKRLIELMVTSRTYRQSSESSRQAEERDPTNRFLSHQNRFRLEAELVRDNALAIAGLLEAKVGGASARPYQPEGYYLPLNFPKREYTPDVGAGLWRRGVYTHWQRTFLLPSFIAFDAPSRDECTANRTPSNTPQQALVMLNDPSYVEAARVLGEKILREGGASPKAKINWAFTRAVARPPRAAETKALQGLLEKQRVRYQQDEAAARELIATGSAPLAKDLPAAELAAWTTVARAILNLHETISRL
jgi:hypothetical protein